MITVSALNALSTVRHAYFSRNHGVSTGAFDSLNCGFGSGDDAANVRKNRAMALERMEMPPEGLVTARQEHGTTVLVVDKPWDNENPPAADGLVTTVPRLVVGVLTADCAPVLMADGTAGVVAAVHAGWRGALGGVLDRAVQVMIEQGASLDRIIAGIGPCIGQRSYEVGPEFPGPFIADDPNNEHYFSPTAREGHFRFDLPGYVARRLALIGITMVMPTPCDTFREEGRFFSYRRNTLRGIKDYGRQLSAIAIER
ncbi:peptidoglycan editing factor PgeF [Caenispirillum bisanense]|uniref:peptidoglycan editing factor PgeF n=1 Tax=Caenispirillum bisanense TaxID=414052 RepID=UPI0031D075B5